MASLKKAGVVVDLTQEEDPVPAPAPVVEQEEFEEEEEILVYTSRVLIKGVQYYRGVAYPGEFVHLTREPHNQYDKNAVRVDNLQMGQVGHLAREVAQILAPLLDSRKANVEATIPTAKGTWTQEVDLSIYATEANLLVVRNYLNRQRHHNFRLVPGPGAGVPPPAAAAAVAAAAAPVQSAVVSKKTMAGGHRSQASIEDLMDRLENTKQYPPFLADSLGPVLLTKLFAHQVDGLSFLIFRETDTALPPFWTLIGSSVL